MKYPEEVQIENTCRLKAIRLDRIQDIVDLHPRTVRRLMKEGNFPQAIQLAHRAIGFYEHEIQDWLRTRPRAM